MTNRVRRPLSKTLEKKSKIGLLENIALSGRGYMPTSEPRVLHLKFCLLRRLFMDSEARNHHVLIGRRIIGVSAMRLKRRLKISAPTLSRCISKTRYSRSLGRIVRTDATGLSARKWTAYFPFVEGR